MTSIPKHTHSTRHFLFALICFMVFPLLLPAQRIDSTFGENGFWVVDEAESQLLLRANGETRVLPNGKLIIADIHNRDLLVQTKIAEYHTGNKCFGSTLWLKMLLPDGSPDSLFGRNGSIFYPLAYRELYYSERNTTFYDIILRPAGGFFLLFKGGKNLLSIYALQSNGSMDSTYGDKGIIVFDQEKAGITGREVISGKLHLLDQGDLLLGGSTISGIFFIQLNKLGDLVPQFGDNGFEYIKTKKFENPNVEYLRAIHVDSCIYALTTTRTKHRSISQAIRSGLIKLHLNGQVDTTFKDEGRYSRLSARFYDLDVLPDGKILILHNVGITALHPSGNLFKHTYFEDLKDWPERSNLTRIYLKESGKMLLSGFSNSQYMVARLMPDFQPDTTYGYAGFRREFHQGRTVENIHQGGITEDDNIFLMSEWGLVRFDSTGNFASDFGSFGTLPVYGYFLSGYWKGIETDSLGDIWAWGNGGENNENFFIGHFSKDGGTPLSNGFQGIKWLNPPLGTDREGDSRDIHNQLRVWHWIGDSTFLLAGRENADGFIQKYNVSGEPDTTFVKIKIDEIITHIISVSSQEIYVNAVDIEPTFEFSLSAQAKKIHADGTLDPTFTSSGYGANLLSIAIFPVEDEKRLIVSSAIGLGSNDPKFLVINRRFKDGSPDVNFGSNGFNLFSIPQELPFPPLGSQLLADQSIRLIGLEGMINISQEGVVDSTAYENTWKPFELGFNFDSVIISNQQLIVEPDSGFLLYGNFQYKGGYKYGIFLARYTKEGDPDISFGDSGLYVLNRPSHSDLVHSILRESDSVYVLAGSSNAQMMMTRLHVPPTKTQAHISVPPDTTLVPDSTNYSQIRIFPNPTSGHSVKIKFQLEEEEGVAISLYSIEGHFIKNLFLAQKQEGNHEETLTLPTNLNPGHYLIRYQSSKTDSWHKIVFTP